MSYYPDGCDFDAAHRDWGSEDCPEERSHDPELAYHAVKALSASGMKALAESPLHYWQRYLNPQAESEEPTLEMKIGSAVHCALLEPDQFDSRYCSALEPPEGCLDTMDDLRAWLKRHVESPKGKLKRDLIEQVRGLDPNVPILQLMEEEFDIQKAKILGTETR